MLNVFQADAFSTTSLTAAINEAPHVPSRLGELGLFDAEGITTTSVTVEKDGNTVGLVSAQPRGSDPEVVSSDKRRMVPFSAVHLPQRSSIMADEVQNVRAFGSEDSEQAMQTLVNGRVAKMRRYLDATLEWQRVGAVRGKILDADGTTELLDIHDRFDLSQVSVNMALDTATTDMKGKCLTVLEHIEDELGALPFANVRVLCGKTFWAKLIAHSKVKDTYDNSRDAAWLRQDPRDQLSFGGMVFERYRGKVGSQAYIPDGEAYAMPEGVPDLFIARFAPADYNEAVNTIGLPYYAKSEPMRFDKGMELEAQSNPIMLCTRPRAVIKLTEKA